MAREPRVLGIVLAGGEGKRLWPLTADRAKPAVPFGGNYRLVDFVLSNLVNAGFLRLCVLTQYKSHSLDRHITTTWRMSQMLGNYVTPVPAQQRLGPRWYTGSADAILQSANLIYDDKPDYIIVFGADHVYRMDPRQMVAQHVASGAGATVAGIRVPRVRGERLRGHRRRRERPGGRLPGEARRAAGPARLARTRPSPRWATTSSPPRRCWRPCASTPRTRTRCTTWARNIMPMMVNKSDAYVYDFDDNEVPGATERDHGYWRDVGTIDAYYDAHMDLVAVHPVFNLYNQRWPIFTHHPQLPPAKFVEGGIAQESIIGAGTIVAGATVRHSVLAPNVRLAAGAYVEGSVLMDGVQVGRGAVVRRAILDKDVIVPEGAHIGLEPDLDRERYHVSEGGVVVLGKSAVAQP